MGLPVERDLLNILGWPAVTYREDLVFLELSISGESEGNGFNNGLCSFSVV
jgi:hypothetical protein